MVKYPPMQEQEPNGHLIQGTIGALAGGLGASIRNAFNKDAT